MTMDFLLTTVIILTEVIIVLGALAIFLFLRMRHYKKRHTPARQTNQSVTVKSAANRKEDIRAYLQTQTSLTKDKIESLDENINPQQQLALASRLSLLSLETEILNSTLDKDSSENDWEIIYKQYGNDDEARDGEESYEDKLAALNTRIKKLEIFKDLFTNAQNKLKQSFNVINDLKTSISELPGAEEHVQIEEMVDQLSVENINLHKQLDEANRQLKNIFEEATLTSKDSDDTDVISDDDNQDLQSENEFLAKQIQELLVQDREKTLAMQERIAELESVEQQKNDKNKIIDDLKEENEFLSRQIQFLLKQELETQETINTLEENIAEATEILEELQSEHKELVQENIDLLEKQHHQADETAVSEETVQPEESLEPEEVTESAESLEANDTVEPVDSVQSEVTVEEETDQSEMTTELDEPNESTEIDTRDDSDKPREEGGSETTKKQP